jgi:WD40 repeat protein/mono/diheme cytochrome c family protein
MTRISRFIACATSILLFSVPVLAETAQEVSYHKDIRPIFQANCQGCHQPAKQSGEYVMTSYGHLMQVGESGEAAITAGQPDKSHLLSLITPVDGKAEMPQGKPPLGQPEIDLIKLWIEQGAKDDSPESFGQRYDAGNPPVYTRPPVISSIDFSPDGSTLAISGFHEVLLRSGDGEQLLGRLVGLSEQIESLKFSQDGTRLAVAGGLPARTGEIQIWNVEKQALELSIPITFDTVYGISWSPDGKMVSVGCSDNIVRGFDSTSGEQIFFNGAHSDWPLNTVFSVDGSQIVSVGRDMSTKLYQVDTERFIDNVTSITPGALKGGLSALERHPTRDEILVGGSDGVPGIYRMNRLTKRVIGDNANLIRRYPKMKGRVFAVAYSPDGKQIVAGSSLDGEGQVFTYSADFDPALPAEIKGIVEVVASSQNADQKKKLEEYVTAGTEVLTKTELPTGLFAIAYHPDGKSIVAAGGDGKLRYIDTATGLVTKEIVPVEIIEQDMQAKRELDAAANADEALVGEEALPTGTQLTALEVAPQAITLNGQYDYVQLLVTGTLNSGDRVDVTRMVTISTTGEAAKASVLGRVTYNSAGQSEITISLGDKTVKVPVTSIEKDASQAISFIQDVNPVLSRLGCNQGTCHGAKDGKNGFKLSLRGYDPLYDVRAFTDDLKSRRTNVASPDNSLMLLKSSGSVAHVGGQLSRPGEPYYEIIRKWISEGCQLELDVPKVAAISIQPEKPVIQNIGGRQQFRVIATYTDGSEKDVTREAYLVSSNTEVAEVNRVGVVTSIRRGEAPILARFEGAYVATTLTAMGDRSGFAWQEPETWTEADKLVAQKWERMKILPSGLCNDEEFIRRAYLDLTGLPPSSEQVEAFMTDQTETRQKRDALIDQLIGSTAYVEYWTNKWADLLQVNRKFLGTEGAVNFRAWIRERVQNNVPYDEFSYQILTASGSNKENPAASYYKILREPTAIMENTTHLFLGVRFNCNKCHDHPFERWTQDQYYETAAFFAQVDLKRDPMNAAGNLGGTAVEGAKPLWEVVFDKTEGDIKHDRTQAVTAPVVPYDRELDLPQDASRRENLAKWITSAENDYFARSYVNRVWGYLMGAGLIEPLDDIRAGNPPTNPELLDHLTEKFIASGFNVQELMTNICKSRSYQLSVGTNEWNQDDKINYSHAVPKRLPAEVLYDSVYTVTGSKMQIPGVPEGTRAAAIPDSGIELKDGFLANLGRPVRESACECERSSDLQLGPVMALMNGPTVSNAISQDGNAINQLVNTVSDNRQLVDQIFMKILNRPAVDREIDVTLEVQKSLEGQHQNLLVERDTYAKDIAPVLAAKEAKRTTAIMTAEENLAKYTADSKPARDAAAKAREDKIAANQKIVDDFIATAPQRLPEFEKSIAATGTPWATLDFGELKTTTGAKLEKQADLSIFASGPNNKKGEYLVTGETELKSISAIKLEVLTDDRTAKRGPGRSGGGNFVLTELTVQAWAKGKPEEKQTLKLKNAQADFEQGGYSIASAIDGLRPNAGNGWATSPKVGEDRKATFELETPLTFEEGTVLNFSLDQQYQDNMHTIGKFRISVTDGATPVNYGNAKFLIDIVNTPVEERTDEQKKRILDHFNSQDPELQKKQKTLADSKNPLAEDPQIVALRGELEDLKKPLPEEPKLARLNRAVELSAKQLENSRLTTAQDLAWALINSPAFLFNR